jgi:MEDS: MEthanogen/methylotroph, DcmR Sensory domain
MADDGAHAHHHAVQFYGTDEHLFTTVGSFISEGLIAGQPAIIIATQPHTAAIFDELSRRLIDVPAARRIGDLVCLDAEETLATFMAGESPDPGAFRKNVGDAIDQALAGRVRTPVRAYGEMVDVLWKRGNPEGAIRLEILWNELAASHSFQLLCGYAMGNFFKQAEYYKKICDQHTEVVADSKVLPFEPRGIPRIA